MARAMTTKPPKALLNQLIAATADDSSWLAKNYATFVERYPERFVAVFNKKVVASHQDISELMRLVDRRLPRAGKLVSTEYITDKRAVVIL